MAFPLSPTNCQFRSAPPRWNIRALSKFHYFPPRIKYISNERGHDSTIAPRTVSKTVTLSRNFPPGYRYFGNRRSRAVITFTPSYKLLYARYVSADDTRATRDPLSSCEISRSRPCDNYPRVKEKVPRFSSITRNRHTFLATLFLP